jgi:hypothetical protein
VPLCADTPKQSQDLIKSGIKQMSQRDAIYSSEDGARTVTQLQARAALGERRRTKAAGGVDPAAVLSALVERGLERGVDLLVIDPGRGCVCL